MALTHSTWTALGAVLFLTAATGRSAAPDMLETLAGLGAKSPAKATVQLELWSRHTLKKQAVTGQGTVSVETEDDPSGLRIQWPDRQLREVDAEARAHDRDHGRATPLRDAVKELDPVRVRHLLDQSGTLLGLIRGATFLEEKADVLDGHASRLLVYRFVPRLSWSEEYHLKKSEARLKLWLDGAGLPVASESSVTYEGKTSRMFGRYAGRIVVRTRYQKVQDRLLVAYRETLTFHSADDESEEERGRQVFRIAVH